MKKQEVINRVIESESSIFSKEDVIRLINSITTETTITRDVFDKILDKIQNTLESSNLVKYDTAEFELSYGNTIELTDVVVDMDEIIDVITDKLEAFVEKEEEEIESE